MRRLRVDRMPRSLLDGDVDMAAREDQSLGLVKSPTSAVAREINKKCLWASSWLTEQPHPHRQNSFATVRGSVKVRTPPRGSFRVTRVSVSSQFNKSLTLWPGRWILTAVAVLEFSFWGPLGWRHFYLGGGAHN